MRSPRTECPLIEESMDDWALWHTVIKRSGRKGGTSKGNWWVPDEAQGNPEESGVLEGNYHTARRLTNAANKPNFFYCGSTKFLFHLNITQKFLTWTTPNNLMFRVILSVQKWPEPHFQPLWQSWDSISARVSKVASVSPGLDHDAVCLSTVSCSFSYCLLVHDVPLLILHSSKWSTTKIIRCIQIAWKI